MSEDRDRATYRVRQGRKFNISVEGKQKEIDKHLLTQAVLAFSRQLSKEQRFFAWLMEQEERVTAGSLIKFRYPVVMVDALIFALFDGGHLVCCLQADDRVEALKIPGTKLWAPAGGQAIFERWVRFPEKTDLPTWEHYGLAAMRYAIEWIESADKQTSNDK